MRTYENEVNEPRFQKRGSGMGHMVEMTDCKDFKSDASDQAYGQAGEMGCRSDEKKIHAQFHRSYTDDAGY